MEKQNKEELDIILYMCNFKLSILENVRKEVVIKHRELRRNRVDDLASYQEIAMMHLLREIDIDTNELKRKRRSIIKST